MIILNSEASGYSVEAEAILRSLGELRNEDLARADLLARVGDAEVLIVRLGNRIDAQVLDSAPRLRVIVSPTTGLDHIDLEAARERGITVLSLQGEEDFLTGVWATAELTWGILLALLRRLPEATEEVRAGEWNRNRFRGRELHGKRLGVLGLGRLGLKVARYGIAFGMQVAALDPHRAAWPDSILRVSDLEALLTRSDVLSVHVPLNAQTRGMLGPRELQLLPQGAVLINTSRGELLDEEALRAALSAGHLAGAALDVISGEQDHQSRKRPSILVAWASRHPDRLLITPHIGGATVESMANTEVFMARKLARFLSAAQAQGT